MAILKSLIASTLGAAGVPKVDISMLGDKELQRKLNRLTGPKAKTVVRSAIRKSAKRAQRRMVANLSGNPVGVDSGRLLAAIKGAKVANASSRGTLYYGVPLPTREQLGIPKKDRGGKKAGYYPVILEYGTSRMAARPWMRPAIDDTADSEKAQIGRDIGKGIERLARKK